MKVQTPLVSYPAKAVVDLLRIKLQTLRCECARCSETSSPLVIQSLVMSKEEGSNWLPYFCCQVT